MFEADCATRHPLLTDKNVKLVVLEREHLENTLRWANDPVLKPQILRVLPVCRAAHERCMKISSRTRPR